jgi:maltose-binding protein MalE
MKRRYTTFAVALVACSLLAVGCTSDSGGDETTTTLSVTSTTVGETTTSSGGASTSVPETTTTVPAGTIVVWADEARAPALDEAASAFTDATGVDVDIVVRDFASIEGEVIADAATGNGPDVFVGSHRWVGDLVADGVIAPIDLGGREGEFIRPGIDALTWAGQLYGVPYLSEAIALYYNTDLSPEPPTTMDDVTSTCDANPDAACLGIPGDAYHMYPFLSVGGGYVFGYDAETGFDVADVGLCTDAAVEGATRLETLVDGGYVPSADYDGAKDLFLDGGLVFWMAGPWELGALSGQDSVGWSVTTLPTIDGDPMRPIVGIEGFFVSRYASDPTMAQDFLLEFVATDGVMDALFAADPTGSAYVATIEGNADDPARSAFSASAEEGQFLPNVPQMGAVWDPLGDAFLAIRDGRLDPARAMQNACDAVTTALEDES